MLFIAIITLCWLSFPILTYLLPNSSAWKRLCEASTFNLVQTPLLGKTQHSYSRRFRAEFRTKSRVWRSDTSFLQTPQKRWWGEKDSQVKILLLFFFFCLVYHYFFLPPTRQLLLLLFLSFCFFLSSQSFCSRGRHKHRQGKGKGESYEWPRAANSQ